MILFRYLCREVYTTMLAIVMVLLIVLISAQLLHYLQEVANGHITLAVLTKLMGLEIPLLLGYLLPLSFFLGIIITLSRMCIDHEMVVLSASGVSHLRLLGMLLALGSVVMLATAWIMLSVEPKVQLYRIKMLNWAVVSYSLHKITPGQFQSMGGWEIYSGYTSEKNGTLNDLFFAHALSANSDYPQGAWQVLRAQSMEQQQDPVTGDNFIVLHHGVEYQGAAPAKNFQITQFQTYGVRMKEFETAANRKDEVKYFPTSMLWKARNQPEPAAELQWRLAMPVSILILACLALPLSYVQPRQGKFGRFFPSILIYLTYMNFIFVTRNWIYDGKLSPHIGMWWLHGALGVVALFLNLHYLGWRRFFRIGTST